MTKNLDPFVTVMQPTIDTARRVVNCASHHKAFAELVRALIVCGEYRAVAEMEFSPAEHGTLLHLAFQSAQNDSPLHGPQGWVNEAHCCQAWVAQAPSASVGDVFVTGKPGAWRVDVALNMGFQELRAGEDLTTALELALGVETLFGAR